MKTSVNPPEPSSGKTFWLIFLLVGCLCVLARSCNAQTVAKYDTIPCYIENIEKFVTIEKSSGKPAIYAVYDSKEIKDLIPVSKSVYEYIQMCTQNGVTPSLGIRLRNQQISGMIRFKQKYRVRR